MTLNELQEIWSNDCQIDNTELDKESLKIPQLHSKYYKIYSLEKLKLKKIQNEAKKLRKLKWEYYKGILDFDEMNKLGWEPIQLKILNNDLDKYVDSDDDIIEMNLKIAYRQEVVSFAEDIVKSLYSRGFNIKSAIDFLKWTGGEC